MTYLNNLKKSALLGTEKMPLQEELLPQVIKEILAKTNKNDHEGYLLKAAAMVMVYEKAGQSPDNVILPEIAPAKSETQEFCSKEAVFVLKTITQSENFNSYLFDYFLNKCLEKNWVLPEYVLVETLSKSTKNTLPKIHQVLGERGKWLTQFNESWQIPDVQSDQKTIWEEGKPAERKTLFAQIRETSPKEATESLNLSWEQESANDRKDFINLFSINLSISDEDFLTEKFQELSIGKSNQKPITLETLRAINLLRLMIPDSIYGKQVFQKVSSYIEQKKVFLGLGNSIKLNLPKNEDDFWNGNTMNQDFGFDKLSSAKGISDAQYWFGELVRYIHPNYWLVFFENDLKKTIVFFKESDGMIFKNEPLFLAQFGDAMKLANEQSIAFFLENLSGKTKNIRLIDLILKLSLPLQEQIIMSHFSLDLAAIKDLMKANTSDWSAAFSHYILKNLVADLQKNNYYGLSEKDFINRLGANLSIKIKDNIFDYAKDLNQDWQKNYWENTFSESLLKQLDMKEAISKI